MVFVHRRRGDDETALTPVPPGSDDDMSEDGREGGGMATPDRPMGGEEDERSGENVPAPPPPPGPVRAANAVPATMEEDDGLRTTANKRPHVKDPRDREAQRWTLTLQQKGGNKPAACRMCSTAFDKGEARLALSLRNFGKER